MKKKDTSAVNQKKIYSSLTPFNTEWQLFDLEFVATSPDENARLIFDLGGHNSPVDINAVLLQRNSEMVIHNMESSAPSLGGVTDTLNAVEPS